jgi:lysophospholipase L1-like esterase
VSHFESYWSRAVPALLESDPDVVVVGLGTNDAATPRNVEAFPGRLDQMMELLGDRSVVWITHVDDRPAAAEDAGRTINEMIRTAPDRWPNLSVLDFTVIINAYKPVLHTDDLHFSPEGMKVYATAIADAVAEALLAAALSDRG